MKPTHRVSQQYIGAMTEKAGLAGFSKALRRALTAGVVDTLQQIAEKSSAMRRQRPPLTVHHYPVYRYVYRYTLLSGGCGIS